MPLTVKTLDEIELKFLVSEYDRDRLPDARCLDIEQTYLKNGSAIEKRVRKTVDIKTGDIVYELYAKGAREGNTRRETITELDESGYEYILSHDAHPTKSPVRKRRYVFDHAGQTFELDVFFDLDLVLMEIELEHADDEVTNFPPYVTIVEEVTYDDRYYNSALAALIYERLQDD